MNAGADELGEKVSAVGKNAGEIKRILERMQAERGAQSISGLYINGGGVGVWIATTCCVVMIALLLVGSIWMSREFARVDKELLERKEEGQRMQSYLSAIYVNAPQLKPKDEADHAD